MYTMLNIYDCIYLFWLFLTFPKKSWKKENLNHQAFVLAMLFASSVIS